MPAARLERRARRGSAPPARAAPPRRRRDRWSPGRRSPRPRRARAARRRLGSTSSRASQARRSQIARPAPTCRPAGARRPRRAADRPPADRSRPSPTPIASSQAAPRPCARTQRAFMRLAVSSPMPRYAPSAPPRRRPARQRWRPRLIGGDVARRSDQPRPPRADSMTTLMRMLPDSFGGFGSARPDTPRPRGGPPSAVHAVCRPTLRLARPDLRRHRSSAIARSACPRGRETMTRHGASSSGSADRRPLSRRRRPRRGRADRAGQGQVDAGLEGDVEGAVAIEPVGEHGHIDRALSWSRTAAACASSARASLMVAEAAAKSGVLGWSVASLAAPWKTASPARWSCSRSSSTRRAVTVARALATCQSSATGPSSPSAAPHGQQPSRNARRCDRRRRRGQLGVGGLERLRALRDREHQRITGIELGGHVGGGRTIAGLGVEVGEHAFPAATS